MALPNEFDFGADVTESAGGFKRVNPEVGLHFARLRSLIHLGTVERIFKGTVKDPSNKVAAIFELKGGDDVDDLHPESGEPLTIGVAFNLIKGDNSFLNKTFLPAMITKKEFEAGTVKGMDELIGRCVQLNLKGSDKKNEDGTPQYVDIESMAAVMQMTAAAIPELVGGFGHVRLAQLKIEHLDEISSYMDVQLGMMKSTQWADGSHPAIALVDEIRKERPNFAKAKEKGAEAQAGAQGATGGNAATPPEELNTEEEF